MVHATRIACTLRASCPRRENLSAAVRSIVRMLTRRGQAMLAGWRSEALAAAGILVPMATSLRGGWVLLLGLLVLLPVGTIVVHGQFDGLYGQDAFAYYDY